MSSSARTALLFGAAAVVVAVGGLILFSMTNGNKQAQSTVGVKPQRTERGDVASDASDPRYRELVAQSNQLTIMEAEKENKSAVATIIGDEPGALAWQETHDLLEAFKRRVDSLEREIKESQSEARRYRQQTQQLKSQRGSASKEDTRIELPYWRDGAGRVYMTQEYFDQSLKGLEREAVALRTELTGTEGFMTATTPVAVRANAEAENLRMAAASAEADENAGSEGDEGIEVFRRGAVVYATFDLAVNSDVPGPVRATVRSGSYAGAVLLGEFDTMEEYVVVKFTSFTLTDGRTGDLNAVAVHPRLLTVGLADDVNHHYLLKFGAVAGAAFLTGYGDAVVEAAQEATVGDDGEVVQSSTMESRDIALAALAEVGRAVSTLLADMADRPTTIQVYPDQGMGVLILDPATL
jgi:type IV secretory pathway VirB10-like protein